MRWPGNIICVAVAAIAGMSAAPVMAGEYSASYVTTMAGQVTAGKVFIADKKVRFDAAGATVIVHSDLGVLWLILPETRVYMELPLVAQYLLFGRDDVPGELGRELIETEIINGNAAEKYRVIINLGIREDVILTWIPPGEDVPLRMMAADGTWETVFSDFIPAAQPASLFEIPAGFKRFSADALALPESGPAMPGAGAGHPVSE